MGDSKSKDYEVQMDVLKILAEIQKESVPIHLSIGWTDTDRRIHQGIVLKSAPPAVAKELMDQGYSLDITPQGVKIYKI